MKVKPVSRLYLTFEVDLDSMSVISIRNGKQGRTYDASQYFQYFVEYGVRKVDVEQLKEHFSINYFQKMLIKSKEPETVFEFCVKFVGKDYKILECRMKVVEHTSSNIIRINLEDISHKRTEQLNYIKEHSSEQEYQPSTKPFDLKFEKLSKKQQRSINHIKCIIIMMIITFSALYAGYIIALYNQEQANTEEDMLANCRTASQILEQQLENSAREIASLEDVIAEFGGSVSEKETLEYLGKSKGKFGYEAAALVDKNSNLVYSKESLYTKLNTADIITNPVNEDFVLLSLRSENGEMFLNYSLFSDRLNIEGKEYAAIMAVYDLSRMGNVISLRGHYYDEQIVMTDLEGKILWDSMRNSSKRQNTDFISCFSADSERKLLSNKMSDIKDNMNAGKSGVFEFVCDGEKTYVAYSPLRIKGLYLFCVTTENFFNERNVRFLSLSAFVWILILLLPSLVIMFVIKHSKKTRRQLEELAYRDNITKGMNTHFFDEMASSAIISMECPYVLVLSNIVNFNIYNEKFGYMKGDEAIRRLFLGICKYIDQDELVCRTYADHMMILLKFETETRIAQRLVEISKCHMSTNLKLEFGICVIRDSTMELEVAKERATLALENGKKQFSEYAAWSFYGLELVEKMSFDKQLENTMYKAFRRGEFKICIEPRYNLEKRALCGGDTYVIWKHPDKGILLPDLFMDIFERRGLVLCLDTYVFEEICKKIRIHLDEGRGVMPVCLKLHKSNFNITNSIDKFKRIKSRYDIPGKYLEFEIPEEIFYEKIDSIGALVENIHAMGCTCIIGDFGGGYLALNVLQNIKVDGVKLDKSWMSLPMPDKMVCAMLEIGKAMEVKTIAAGITEEAQVRHLKSCHCDEGTGKVFSKTITLQEYINIF